MKLLFKDITAQTIGETSFVEHYTGVNYSMFTKKLQPAIRQATQLFVLKWLSRDFYNDLAEKYNNDSLQASEKEALTMLQDAIAHYAIAKKLDEGGANLSELGLHYRSDGDGSTSNVPSWQFFKAKYDLVKSADAFLESFLTYVYENSTDFSAFALELNVFFINSPGEFSKYIPIQNSLMTFVNVLPFMRKVSEQVLKGLLDSLYDSLLQSSRENNTTGLQLELLNKVNAYLATASLVRAVPFLNIDLSDGKLFSVSTSDGFLKRAAANENQVERLVEGLEQQANEAFKDLQKFLFDNKDSLGLTIEEEESARVVVTSNSVGLF